MMKNQLAGLMQQAQKMQENMKRMQEQLASLSTQASAVTGRPDVAFESQALEKAL